MKRKYTDLLLPVTAAHTKKTLRLLCTALFAFMCAITQAVKAQDVFALNSSLVDAEARRAATLRNYDLQSLSSNNYDVHFLPVPLDC